MHSMCSPVVFEYIGFVGRMQWVPCQRIQYKIYSHCHCAVFFLIVVVVVRMQFCSLWNFYSNEFFRSPYDSYTYVFKRNNIIIIECILYAGLPMSLSSTGNSLKSSGTFNSNSSINSTPSVDRYAALKDLDEQLREMKEKDINTQTASHPANPFNSPQTATVGNPFQATQIQSTIAVPTQNGWHHDQQPFNNVRNGASPNMFGSPHGFGMNGVAAGPYMNVNGLQQSQQQHYQKMPSQNMYNGSIGMSSGYPQKNPFAVSNQ